MRYQLQVQIGQGSVMHIKGTEVEKWCTNQKFIDNSKEKERNNMQYTQQRTSLN